MTEYATAKSGLRIRLTDERWAHITEEHCEIAGMRVDVLDCIERPERVLSGKAGELLAVRQIEPGKHVVVVYRELQEDGFVITAFLTRRSRSLDGRTRIWP